MAKFLQFQAFTTAVVQDQRIRNQIKQYLVDGIKNGTDPKQVKKQIFEYLTPQEDNLNVPKSRLYTAIDNIYRTNTALAHGMGQQQALIENSDTFPAWQYRAVMDNRTRPEHASLNGRVFASNDTAFFPPIGFRCRCRAKLLTASQAKKYNIEYSNDVPKKDLINATFIGNKQANFLRWLQANEPEHPISKKLIQVAIDRLKKDISDLQKEELKSLIKEAKDFAKKLIPDSHKGMNIGKLPNFITHKINLRPSDYKEVIGHNPNKSIYKYLKILHKEVKNWEYIGYSTEVKGKPWHYALIYKFSYKGKTFYANVGWHIRRGEIIYAIQQTNSSKMIKGLPPKIKK